jgi:hypothetical protein
VDCDCILLTFLKKNTFDFFVAQPNDTARGC